MAPLIAISGNASGRRSVYYINQRIQRHSKIRLHNHGTMWGLIFVKTSMILSSSLVKIRVAMLASCSP